MPRGRPRKIGEVTEVDADAENAAEEYELVSFLDGLGPAGISEVVLYRVMATGKQRFVTAGPPGQFTEQYVQQTYGGGDYLVRAKLNGKWFRSKNFAIEGPAFVDPNGINYGGNINGNGNGNHTADMERLKLDLEAQRLRLQEQQSQMEADRQARDQRNHELQLKLIESSRQAAPAVSVPEMIAGIKSLKELSSGQDEILGNMEKSLAIIERISNLRGNGSSENGGWMDWLKPVAVEAGKQLLPRILPLISPQPAPPGTIGTTPAMAPVAPAPSSVVSAEGGGVAPPPVEPPPGEPTPEEQYLFNKRQALAFIIPIARMGREPDFYAEAAIEQIETAGNQVIARFVDEIVRAESFEQWFRELQGIEPTVITSQRWFELFFNAVRSIISERATDANDVDQ